MNAQKEYRVQRVIPVGQYNEDLLLQMTRHDVLRKCLEMAMSPVVQGLFQSAMINKAVTEVSINLDFPGKIVTAYVNIEYLGDSIADWFESNAYKQLCKGPQPYSP